MAFPAYIGPRDAVGTSDDLERILALPRRAPVDLGPASVRAEAFVEIVTARLRRPDRPPGASCGCAALGRRCLDRLLPAQAWALWEAPLANGGRGGLLGPIGVGAGKTILDILMPMVIPDCRTAVLFVPPGLVAQLEAEYLALREHFCVPTLLLPDGIAGHYVTGAPTLRVVPYSRLCRPESSDLLEKIGADLFIADEVHRLKNREASQTGRVVRYLAAHPDTRFCGWSGTITKDKLEDFAHLSAFALGEGSPVPIDPDVVEQWAAVVNPSDWPAPAGDLRRLVAPGESVLQAVGRRVRETFGVVSTGLRTSSDATVILRERRPALPARLRTMIAELRATWLRPDGEELIDAMSVERCAVQLVSGFFYRWRFPGKPDPMLVEEWFAARKAWGREMRSKLARGETHLDSPKLLANAAERAWAVEPYKGDLPTWKADAWPRWRDIKDAVKHETEAVWVDEYLARDAADWGADHRGIIWYEYSAFGERVADLGDLPLHGGGPNAATRLAAEKGDRSIVASIASHHEGRNGLQFIFDEQLVTAPMPSGKEWEQLLGRLSRTGQRADEVVTEVYRHTPEFRESVDRAVREAKYVEGMLTASQMLLAATVEWALG